MCIGAPGLGLLRSVERHHPYWMVGLDDSGRVSAYVENSVDRRQDLPALFMPDGGVIAVTRESLLGSSDDHPHAFLGSDRRGVRNDAGAVLDIDSPQDLEIAAHRLNSHAPEKTHRGGPQRAAERRWK